MDVSPGSKFGKFIGFCLAFFLPLQLFEQLCHGRIVGRCRRQLFRIASRGGHSTDIAIHSNQCIEQLPVVGMALVRPCEQTDCSSVRLN
jgi:hypothetical protein